MLRTNVVVPLGMMSPACGVEPRGRLKAAIRLVRGQRIPSQKGALVETRVVGSVPGSAVLFEPRNDWSQSLGMELKGSLVCPDHEGKVLILIRNTTAETLQVHPGELIGSMDSFELEMDLVADNAPTSLEEDGVAVVRVIPQAEDRCKKLATFLRKGKDSERGRAADSGLCFRLP